MKSVKKFKTDQVLIAMKDHPEGCFKKGWVFLVYEVKNSNCGCHEFLVDVGFPRLKRSAHFTCTECLQQFWYTDTIRWFSNVYFAPIEYGYADLILEEIERKDKELYLVNQL